MPGDKDIVVEARELLADPQMEPFLFGVTRDVFRALADEVERLREDNESLREICEQKDAI